MRLVPGPRAPAIYLLFLKLFERVYALLTAELLRPVTADTRLAEKKRHRLDRLYQRIVTSLTRSLRPSARGRRMSARGKPAHNSHKELDNGVKVNVKTAVCRKFLNRV